MEWKPQLQVHQYWLGFVENGANATRGGSGSIPGSEIFPWIYNSSTHRGRKRWSSGLIPPHTVWKPPPRWLIGDWLGFVEQAPPGEGKGPSSDPKSLHTCTIPYTPGKKKVVPRVHTCTVWKPQPQRLVFYWLGFSEPAPPEEDRVSSPDQKYFYASIPTNRGRKRRSPGPMPPRMGWKPQPNWLIAD